MKRITLLCLVFVGALNTLAKDSLPPLKPAKPSPAIQSLEKQIAAILLLSKNKQLQVSIQLISLQTNEILYALEPETGLVPASVNKILTSYTALKKLGPTSTFKTSLYHEGRISDGTLQGNLYLKGGGDPSLVSERMWMLTNDFIRQGIKRVRGDLIGDANYFDTERTPPSRPEYLKDEAYNAPVGALSFNFNTTTIYASPGDKVGQPPQVYIDPENSYVEVVNQAKTVKAGSGTDLSVARLEGVKGDRGDTVLVRGKIAFDSDEVRFYRNIVNPTLYTCQMFQEFLERRGIKIEGSIKEGKVPSSAKEILVFESLPLWQVIWGLNKFSNNFVADQILKKLGAEFWGVPGTLQKGLVVTQDTLEDIGMSRKSYQLEDGSGLTRKSRLSAAQVTQVLLAAYHDFTISSEFMASLGRAGEDGTLKKRIPGSIAKGQIRAKTGSLDGVAALAGYASTLEGEPVAFAILLNDPGKKYGLMTGWIDKIVLSFRKFSRTMN